MKAGIRIAHLADHPETIPTLSLWFQAQWPAYYGARTLADIAGDFQAEARHSGLPLRLVAFVAGELAGTITLREEALRGAAGYRPGLGGLLVPERFRGRGIGSTLVKAGMLTAQKQGFTSLYATTVTAKSILERQGWQLIQAITHGDEQLLLYGWAIVSVGPE